MANEITIQLGLRFSKGGNSASKTPTALLRDMTGADYVELTQTVGTSAEALDLGDITTAGYIWIKNTDATNFVEIRDGSGGADVVKLLAGDEAVFRLATSTPYAIADTASCVVKYLLLEA